MSLALRRFGVYLRLILALLVLGAIGLVLFQNRNYKVRLWFFGLIDETKEINIVWVILSTALITRTVWFVLSFCSRLWRDLREVRKEEAREEVAKEQQRRETDLADRERRLQEQLKGASHPAEMAVPPKTFNDPL